MRTWDRHIGEQTPCACGCGGSVKSPDARGRPRRFVRGHSTHKRRNVWKGRKHSAETRAKISATRSRPSPWLAGEANGMSGTYRHANPNYKDGSSPERQRLYANAEHKAVLRAVRRRDGGCVNCRSGARLHVHHVKPWAEYPELRFDPANLVTLCQPCHADAHRRRGT